MNVLTTTQPQSEAIAYNSELNNRKSSFRLEMFLMAFIIVASSYCVAYLLKGEHPIPNSPAELFQSSSSKTTLGFLAAR